MLHGKRDQALKKSKQCTESEPEYIHTYLTAANYLQPRWGGSKHQQLKFIEESADSTVHIYGNGLYALLVGDYTGRTGKIFTGYGGYFSWPRTKKGIYDLFEKYGKSN